MVKSYLRYTAEPSFGSIASAGCHNVLMDGTGFHAVSAAVEDVIVWNLKQGVEIRRFHAADLEVTCLQFSPDFTRVAAGYSNGSVRIWKFHDGQLLTTMTGHKNSVTALAFDKDGTVLATGGHDTDIVLWDTISESGMFRLRGHKDAVTDLKFTKDGKRVISSSKDSLIKFWDIDTRHCIQTLTAARSEIWSFDVNSEETRLVVATSESEIKVFDLNPQPDAEDEEKKTSDLQVSAMPKSWGIASYADEQMLADAPGLRIPLPKIMGTLTRESKDRSVSIRFDHSGVFLACQGSDKVIDLYRVRGEEEAKKKMKRRLKRKREKANKSSEEPSTAADDVTEPVEPSSSNSPLAQDEFEQYQQLMATGKLRAFTFAQSYRKASEPQIMVALQTNAIEFYVVSPDESRLLNEIALPGHRTDIRAIALSSEDAMLMTASSSQVKVWNVSSHQCIRTVDSGYGCCAAFMPGNKNAMLGTKTGALQLFDLHGSTMIEEIKAHDGPIWGMHIHPSGRGFVTGSADKQVKLWDFAVATDSDTGARRVTVSNTKSLTMTEDVLAVRFSPDGKFLAVALLDNTVKIFFVDSLKFYLSLYGHRLPVTSIDISSDSKLIVTASSDKNVKIWGLDFGDCHKSMFAHEDIVTSVAFVKNTHYFFTASKDGTVKYWDGDKFEHIQTLTGHAGPVWCLTVNSTGNMVVSGSHDRTIRIARETEEMLFLSDEREAELDRKLDANAEHEAGNVVVFTDVDAETGLAARHTGETLKAGERVLDALSIADRERQRWSEYEAALRDAKANKSTVLPPTPGVNPFLQGNSVERYMLISLMKIKSAELEPSLLGLPFAAAMSILSFAEGWLKQGWESELVSRVIFTLLGVHHNQIVASKIMLPVVATLQDQLRLHLKQERDTLGFNLAALKFVQRDMEMNSTATFFDIRETLAAAAERRQLKKKPKKKSKKNAEGEQEDFMKL